MSETSQEDFSNSSYDMESDIYDKSNIKNQSTNLNILIEYGDSLAKCGRIRESIDVFSQCLNHTLLSPDKLKNLATALLDDLSNSTIKKRVYDFTFSCPACEGTLYQPITTSCGHTYCKNCLELYKFCRSCGIKINTVGEINVLVKRLVEQWWPREAQASKARHEGDHFLIKGHLAQALEHYNLALKFVPNSPLHLSNRSYVLLLLNQPQASLADADHAVRLRPDWGKGQYRRGIALTAIGRHEEAFFALCKSVAIDKNPQNLRHEITRVLHRVLSPTYRRHGTITTKSPYNLLGSNECGYVRRNRHHRRHHHHYNLHHRHHNYHHHNNNNNNNNNNSNNTNNILRPLTSSSNHRMALNSSDCEDNSSGEEEFNQSTYRRQASNNISSTSVKLHAILDRVYQEVEKLKRVDVLPAEILLPPLSNGISVDELNCILCCRLLWKPVTTPCGHTYCWMCLDRCLDYSSTCPLCVTSLSNYLANNQKTVTDFIDKALMAISPTEYASRASSHRLELVRDLGILGNQHIAVFVCTTAFPCVACPLYVFEPRYRLMVRRCLESGIRRFGIAACFNRVASGSKRYAEYGTVLEIKDRVLMKDGCSILSTVGKRRFRVISGDERDGYDTAEVELLRDSPIQLENLQTLCQLHEKVRLKALKWWTTVSIKQQIEIQRVFGKIPNPEDNWWNLPDGPSWTWWILAILPLGPQLQVGILGTTSMEKRFRAIEKTLNHMEKRQLTVTTSPAENDTSTLTSSCHDGNNFTNSTVSVVHHS